MTIFGMPYMMLLPAYADKVILGGKAVVPEVVSIFGWTHVFVLNKETVTAYLMAANGLGAVAGALVVASLKRGGSRANLIPVIMVGVRDHAHRVLAVEPAVAVDAALGARRRGRAQHQLAHEHDDPGERARVSSEAASWRCSSCRSWASCRSRRSSSAPSARLIGPGSAILVGAVVLLGWALFLVSRPKLLQPSTGAQ